MAQENQEILSIEFFSRLVSYWPVAYTSDKFSSLVEQGKQCHTFIKSSVEYSENLTNCVRKQVFQKLANHTELVKQADHYSCKGLDLFDTVSEKSTQIYTQFHIPSKVEIVDFASTSKDKAQQYAYDSSKELVESGKQLMGKTYQSGKNKLDDTKEYIQKKYLEEYQDNQVVVFTRERVLIPTHSCIQETVLPKAKVGFESYAPQALQDVVQRVRERVIETYDEDQFPFVSTVSTLLQTVYSEAKQIYEQRKAKVEQKAVEEVIETAVATEKETGSGVAAEIERQFEKEKEEAEAAEQDQDDEDEDEHEDEE